MRGIPSARALLLAVASVMAVGGCPRAEDGLEPNDSAAMATDVAAGEVVEGRVIQGDADVFRITAGAGTRLRIRMDSIGEEEEDCAAFRLEAPDGEVLYDDNAISCSRGLDEPTRADGVTLVHTEGVGFELVAPADLSGSYVLTLIETGHADNVFTYSWRYRMTVTEE